MPISINYDYAFKISKLYVKHCLEDGIQRHWLLSENMTHKKYLRPFMKLMYRKMIPRNYTLLVKSTYHDRYDIRKR